MYNHSTTLLIVFTKEIFQNMLEILMFPCYKT